MMHGQSTLTLGQKITIMGVQRTTQRPLTTQRLLVWIPIGRYVKYHNTLYLYSQILHKKGSVCRGKKICMGCRAANSTDTSPKSLAVIIAITYIRWMK